MASPSASEVLRTEALQVDLPDWRGIAVTGAHRERFVHSQLTSDVAGLMSGRAQLSALLDGSGRLVAVALVAKGPEVIHLVVPTDAADAVRASLESRIIADDVVLHPPDPRPVWVQLGPAAVAAALAEPASEHFHCEVLGEAGVLGWGDPPVSAEAMAPDEVRVRQVVTGFPRWGEAPTSGALVNETTLVDQAVSFEKGCFLGQETVAKVASRRGAAYAVVALELEGEPVQPPPEGSRFSVGDRTRAGEVVAVVRWGERVVVEARLHRELRVEGRRLQLEVEGLEPVAATVRRLPLLEPRSIGAMADDCYHDAVAAFTADREERAIELLHRVLALQPDHADAYESLGVILGRHGRYDEAIALMQRLLEVDPGSVMAHTNMSLYYNHLGRIEDAERELERAARKRLEAAQAERDREAAVSADEERRRAELEEREQMFRQVLELDPDDALANFGIGQILVDADRPQEAVPHLERALASDPRYSAAYLALGRALAAVGQAGRAREVFAHGIDVAAGRGDLMTANQMQDQLAQMEPVT